MNFLNKVAPSEVGSHLDSVHCRAHVNKVHPWPSFTAKQKRSPQKGVMEPRGFTSAQKSKETQALPNPPNAPSGYQDGIESDAVATEEQKEIRGKSGPVIVARKFHVNRSTGLRRKGILTLLCQSLEEPHQDATACPSVCPWVEKEILRRKPAPHSSHVRHPKPSSHRSIRRTSSLIPF